ncbi:hypothetical protein psal_cds_400 [Pandoravirus salinus]|uniref:Uncharacterized protein n=1 Tax=Pandoravirus salinus TaxID=1349410 RepID=S4VU97_9VIRU|nr:hypothetical protein psal_cds_400 [Pandoravirus salinus]AGO84099.1 hypothetical protein psal_cds_400 [Pandoravirus salinus]
MSLYDRADLIDVALMGPRNGFVAVAPLAAWPPGFDAVAGEYNAGFYADSADNNGGGDLVGSQVAAVRAAAEAAWVRPQDEIFTNAQLGLPEGETRLPAIDVALSGVSTLAPGARFARGAAPFEAQVLVDPVDALALVEFWSDIMRDHMHFLGMWLLDTPVPTSGASGSGGEGDHAPEAGAFKQEARDLEAAWSAYIDGPMAAGDLSVAWLSQLIGETGLLKNRILEAVRAGQYVGGVYESFLLDNLMEVDYFVDALAGEVGGQREVDMWNEHARGHALLDAHMLDPLMVKEIIDALVLAEQFLAVNEGASREPLAAPTPLDALGGRTSADEIITEGMRRLAAEADSPAAASAAYLEALEAIRARMDGEGARVSGVTPHRLVVHTIREIAYGLERIQQIQGNA